MGVTLGITTRFPRLGCATAAILVGVIAMIAGAATARSETAATHNRAQSKPVRPLVLVPGLLGSRLCRPDPSNPKATQVVWGTVGALRQFPTIRLAQDGANDQVRPCGLVREIVFLGLYRQDVYAPILEQLAKVGYRENRDLFVFAYDWRRSIFDNAKSLEAFVRNSVPDGKVDILAHSMGALVARAYVVDGEGGDRVARLFSAGAPFQGSVKVFQTVEKGWGPLNAVMGGLDGFRRTMLSFPSIFELMPRYEACCEAGTGSAFDPSNPETWTGLRWDGVDTATMPDLQRTFVRIRKLQALAATAMPKGVEDVLLVGIDQRTPEKASFTMEGDLSVLRVAHTWAGDGSVIRSSAVIDHAPSYPTSFADHQRILNDPQIQDFLRVALTKGVAEAMATVPVRERGKMRAVDGSLTELVGIRIEPDEPIYRTGDLCKVHVHLRLGDRTKVSPAAIKLVRRMPDGRETEIRLTPDPTASDPGNPFEQSFVGRFEAGVVPGTGKLRATVELADRKLRLVEEPVPVIAR